jgi:adhesin/invasin
MVNRSMIIRLWIVALVAMAVAIACDSVPLTSPTGSTISISIDRGVLPLNAQATVRAIVTESSGTPVHNGTMVTFQPSIGTVNPPSVETVNGVAISTFFAGTMSGSGVIHAYSGGARTGSGNSSSGGAEVRIGWAAVGTMAISASPSSVSQSGGTVTISAFVGDDSSNPLPGVPVIFTAAAGSLSSNTALSDANGVARVQFTTSQTATVSANAGTSTVVIEIVVSPAPTVTITAPDTAIAGVPVPVSVSVTTGGGNVAPRQVESLTINYGDNFTETRTNVTGAVGFTHTYQNAGGYTITATARDVTNNTGSTSKGIVVTHATLPTVQLTASPNPVPPAANGVTSITVTGTPGNGGAPIRSVVVRKSDGTVIFSGTGTNTFTYQFPAGSGQNQISATATDANGQTATVTTVVIVG